MHAWLQIISQVETTLGEVGEIFTELAGLVNEQSANIDHISSAIENTGSPRSNPNHDPNPDPNPVAAHGSRSMFRVISLAASQASRAADELFSASKYQHRARSRKCCIAMGLLIALVLLLLTSVSLRS